MTREATIGGSAVLDLLEALRSFGLVPEVLCRAVGVDPATMRAATLLRDPAARVPASWW